MPVYKLYSTRVVRYCPCKPVNHSQQYSNQLLLVLWSVMIQRTKCDNAFFGYRKWILFEWSICSKFMLIWSDQLIKTPDFILMVFINASLCDTQHVAILWWYHYIVEEWLHTRTEPVITSLTIVPLMWSDAPLVWNEVMWNGNVTALFPTSGRIEGSSARSEPFSRQ